MGLTFSTSLAAAAVLALTSPAAGQQADAQASPPDVNLSLAAERLYLSGKEDEAISILSNAVAANDESALRRLVGIYFGPPHKMTSYLCRDDSKSPKKGLDLLRARSEGGDTAAMLMLAENYLSSRCVKAPQDAIALYVKAADMGRLQAKATLAQIYASGDGVPKDMAKADYWRTQAFQQAGPNRARENTRLTLWDGKGESAFMICGTTLWTNLLSDNDCPTGWQANSP